jgi:hypothetical protein
MGTVLEQTMNTEQHELSGSMTLIAAQNDEFRDTGLLHLPGAIAEHDVREMRDHLWAGLESLRQIRRDDRKTWPIGKVSHLQGIYGDGAFAKMFSPPVGAALDSLFEPEGWKNPSRWGSLLVNFPEPDREWNVPNQVWHLDVGSGGVQAAPDAVIVFAFLDMVAPGGGGTTVVIGTHRLVLELAGPNARRTSSADARKLLARCDPWLNDLWSSGTPEERMRRFMEEGTVIKGIPLKVVELTANPGDVVIMHPGLLHAGSPTCGATPRLVVRQDLYRAAAKVLSAAS